MISENSIKEKLLELVKTRNVEISREISQLKEQDNRVAKRRESYLKDITPVFKKQKIDLSSIMAVEQRRSKITEKDIQRTRQNLTNSKARNSGYHELGESDIDLLGWITFCRPAFYTVQHTETGTIHARGFRIYDLDPWIKLSGPAATRAIIYVDRWFIFVPPASGLYFFKVFQPLHGFYIVRSDEGIFESKSAWVKIESSIGVNQYYWRSSGWSTRFFEGGDIAFFDGRIDRVEETFYPAMLGGNDPAFVLLNYRLTCYVDGHGTYAELNFSDGNANRMPAPCFVPIRSTT